MGERGNGDQPGVETPASPATPKVVELKGAVYIASGQPPLRLPGSLPVIPLPGGGYIQFLPTNDPTDPHHGS
ncbi:MAG: hypothetical protein JNM17_01965 [Archangium sp.]|nr:hypothetical protein [Archangium sp.]